jgi:hypothetical protein
VAGPTGDPAPPQETAMAAMTTRRRPTIPVYRAALAIAARTAGTAHMRAPPSSAPSLSNS